MRFGFCTIPSQPFEALCDLVHHAEKRGYDRYWVPDQSFFNDPFTILGALALRVGSIRLGLGVVNPYSRQPALVARGAATVAKLCGEGFVLAYGAGNRHELINRLGFEAMEPARRCREAMDIVRRLMAGEEVNRPGPLWPMEGVRLEFPLPPSIPVYMSARGPRMLRMAGEGAEGVILSSLATPEAVEYTLSEVRRGAARAGREVGSLPFFLWTVCMVADYPGPLREMMRGSIGHSVSNSAEPVLNAMGFDPEEIASLKTAYRADGPAGAAPRVTEKMIDAFSLIGTPENIVSRLRAAERVGVTDLTLLMPAAGVGGSHGVSRFDHKENLERFATEVMPHLR